MRGTYAAKTEAILTQHHRREVSPNQCSSRLTQTIGAPMGLVWSMVRDFGQPQAYKRFVKNCLMRSGDGGVGSVREVRVVSGLPAGVSVERLERLDDDARVMSFSIIGGDHRLENYRSTTSVHEEDDLDHDHDHDHDRITEKRTVVIESYVVDVPSGSSEEDTCAFANTIIRCNLMSLARIAEKIAAGS
ncbi:hypothetical protein L484_003811 [Morus notabilis]|uniref:Uncharacterized protein n=1 Tax=Morus notabilis TaxID=981085 RepID=W9SSK9_9ROSA|nr:abscisic acid receptor PYL11 [Morus notabilis]EXC24834.1 hypothetical protein L484_003811 [Morus notabilis]